MAALGADETVAAPGPGRGRRPGPRGGGPRGPLRRARGARRPGRRPPRAARPHPRRPGRDRAAGPGPRQRRPLDRRDAAVVRRVRAAAARRPPVRDRGGLRGRGDPVVGRPPQRRPARSPGAGSGTRCCRCWSASSARASPRPSPAPPTSCAPDMEALDRMAAEQHALLRSDDGLPLAGARTSSTRPSPPGCCGWPRSTPGPATPSCSTCTSRALVDLAAGDGHRAGAAARPRHGGAASGRRLRFRPHLCGILTPWTPPTSKTTSSTCSSPRPRSRSGSASWPSRSRPTTTARTC